MEDQSKNTEQNLQNSYGIIKERYPESNHRAAIVTNYFHIFRAVVLARKMGYKCVGYGARTKLYYSLNAFIRDFIGYVVLTWKKQLLALILFLLVINFFTILEYVNNSLSKRLSNRAVFFFSSPNNFFLFFCIILFRNSVF